MGPGMLAPKGCHAATGIAVCANAAQLHRLAHRLVLAAQSADVSGDVKAMKLDQHRQPVHAQLFWQVITDGTHHTLACPCSTCSRARPRLSGDKASVA